MSDQEKKDLAIINFEYELPSINKIVRQPTQLKIDYDLLAKLCSIGCSMTECAFALGTTTQVLDLRIRNQKKMTFHEFQGFYESFQSISIRRKMLEKAVVDGHFPSLQWLSINHLGMSKDGMMKKDEGAENNNFTTQELVDQVRRSIHGGKKKDNEQCESPISDRSVQRESRDPSPRVYNNADSGSGRTGLSNKKHEGGEKCRSRTNPNQVTKKLQAKINPNNKTREKIQAAKKSALESINNTKGTTSIEKKKDG